MGKKIIVFLTALLATIAAQSQTSYYFGDNSQLNKSIPTPEEFFGHAIGQQLVRYDRVVEYFRLLDKLSDRAQLKVIGHSHENREYVILHISTPENIKNLESIRQQHVKLVDPNYAYPSSYDDQKVVIQLGYNVHGGELAGTDASVLAAYFFVATEDADIVKRLSDAIVLIEPALNPDGRERAAQYFNAFHSTPSVSDALDIEHTQSFTPLRGNHFYADLNRDWFALVHPESRARAAYYHQWYPNIYADYHEMGRNSSYYFEPSPVKSTWNYTIPESTYTELNVILANYFGAELDKIGSLYFTKENYDNISPIYGSTYPDFQGGVGTTLEVGSSQGVEVESSLGLHRFAKNIRDNVRTSIGTLKAGTDKKDVFLRHQQEFFKSAVTKGGKGYIVFGSLDDKGATRLFLDNLLRHKIEVHQLTKDYSQGGKQFKAGNAYVIPLAQAQYRLVNAAFEEHTEFVDSIFMDITAWSTAHGYGFPFARVAASLGVGDVVTEVPAASAQAFRQSQFAYVIDYADFYAPRVLYTLLDKGIYVKAAFKTFTTETAEAGQKRFATGSLVVPLVYQTVSADSVYRTIRSAVAGTDVQVYSVATSGSSEGIDLGSDNIQEVKKPVVATFVSASGTGGINWTAIGETWHLLGNHQNIPLTKIFADYADRTPLERYTAIILVDGSYQSFSKTFVERLKSWVANGGVLITSQRASQWAIENGIATHFAAKEKKEGEKAQDDKQAPRRLDYSAQREQNGPSRIGGVLYAADLDITNPLAFGIHSRQLYTMKSGNFILPRPQSPYASLLQLQGDKQLGGYLTKANQKLLKDATVIATDNLGSGTIVLFSESPTYRGYWLSTGRILTNALFFGNRVSTASRYRP
jgi:hypothetical protein